MRLALIGGDVSRSLSGEMHTFILNAWGVPCEYEHASADAAEFDGTARRLLDGTVGFNVTVPYKLDIQRHISRLEGDALAFGSVNTVVSKDKIGYNTDGVGFMCMLDYAGIEVRGKSVLVLGAGGAARAVIGSLVRAGAAVSVYNRTPQRALQLQAQMGGFAVCENAIGSYDVVVNTTSAGMGAQAEVMPCPLATAQAAGALVDIVYHPPKTAFLAVADGTGARAINGLAMLFFQAYYSDCIYLSKAPDTAEAIVLYTKYLLNREKTL